MLNKPTKIAPFILLLAITVSGISTFMIYPLLVFRLLDVGFSVGDIGLILGILSGTGRLCSFVIGIANNKFGSKITVCLGILLRVIGISIFAFESSLSMYVSFAALASIGSSASALGIKTELLRLSAERRLITMRSMAINSGAIIGPALGAALYYFLSFHVILYLSIGGYLMLACMLAMTRFSPPESLKSPLKPETKKPKKYRGFVYITLVASIYWAIYSQWSLVVPLISKQACHCEQLSNVVYMANAVIVLLLQYPLVVIALKSVRDSTILLLGFSVFFASFWALFAPPSFVTVALFCLGFSVAELLISPTLDSQTAKFAPSSLGLTKSYGLQDTISGIFSIGGTSIGGWAIDHFQSLSASAVFCLPLAFIAVFLILLKVQPLAKG